MELKRPHKRIRISWTVYTLLASLLPCAISVLLFSLPIVPTALARVFTGLWIAVWLFFVVIYFPLRYRCLHYGVNDDCIIAKTGVYFSTQHWMPLHAVRHITVIRGPLEKLLGISFVVISAAGGWLLLEGIPTDEAFALREKFQRQDAL